MIYQTLPDLRDACTEAIHEGGEAIDFEVGVFSGKYTTPVTSAYFDHLSRLRGNKKRKAASMARDGENGQTVVVASGGPVNGATCNGTVEDEEDDDKRHKGPVNREDVR